MGSQKESSEQRERLIMGVAAFELCRTELVTQNSGIVVDGDGRLKRVCSNLGGYKV